MERGIRLRRSRDVQRAFEEGKSWAHPLLRLVACPNGLGLSRIGVTASRRVGGAVARSRAKRLLRESARTLYSRFGSGWDVMLVARPGLPDRKQPEVEEALATLLEEAGLEAPDRAPQSLGGTAVEEPVW
jgi:ribonuclease P protein component